MKVNNKIFFSGIVILTCPLLLGAGLISERERIILAVLSLSLFMFHILKFKALLHSALFLSLFISTFLNSQFIFFERIDLFLFQAAALGFGFIQRRNWLPDSFSIGIIGVVIATFLLQFLTNQILVGFYLNFWIDLKRHWPVFLFCITYFIMMPFRDEAQGLNKKVYYFTGLFILTFFLSYLSPGVWRGVATKKVKHNLAFFYKDRVGWKDMGTTFRRGLAYEYLGLWSKARDEFKKIIISSPEDVDAHFNLAESYAAEKFWYEAMLEYKNVVELNPTYHESHYGLARAYEALGDIKKAEEEFLKEIEINPEEIRAYLGLEEFYERQGLIKQMERIRVRHFAEITSSIYEKDISDANLRVLPVVLNGGPLTIEIVARGTYAQGFWPRMEVWLSNEGRLVRGGDTFVRSDTWKSYYFHFDASAGEENLLLHFINDYYGGPENDRNLYIKRINFIYGR